MYFGQHFRAVSGCPSDLVSEHLIVRFQLVDLLPTSYAVPMLDMLSCLIPVGNPMPVDVAIFWFGQDKPVFDFSPSSGRVHFSLRKASSLIRTLLPPNPAVTQKYFFWIRLCHGRNPNGFPSWCVRLSTIPRVRVAVGVPVRFRLGDSNPST